MTRKGGSGRSDDPEWTDREILAPYIRIICQLTAEYKHGKKNAAHEAVRRQTYAAMTLDAFGEEFTTYQGAADHFRSKVLTPIMQRHLHAIPDAYTPDVRAAVAPNTHGQPTIADATAFYLAFDPTDPAIIPNLRHNIIHIPEVRWHLGLVMGVHNLEDEEPYSLTKCNQVALNRSLKNFKEDGVTNDILRLDSAEVYIVVREMLEKFFEPELAEPVRLRSFHVNKV